MRQHSNRQAGLTRVVGILLAVILSAGLLTGGLAAADATVGNQPGMATPAALEDGGGGGF